MIRGTFAALAAGALAAAGLAGPAQAAPATGTVRGTYTTDAGAPIAGAVVYSTSIDYDNWTRVATTDALGRYQVVDVPAGRVVLEFHASGISQWAPQATDPASATRFTVIAGLALTVDERQLPTGTIQGRVTTAVGTPIHQGWVYVRSAANRPLRTARTDADGRYIVPDIPVGPVKIEFNSGGSDGFSQWAHDATDFASATAFTVVAGETLTVDETQFATGTITGRLTDETGAPATGFTAGAAQVGGDWSISARSGPDGRYTITVPAGQWRVRFASLGRSTPQWMPGKANEADGEIVTVAAGQSIEVNEALLPTGSVSGTLRGATGRPMSDRAVALWRDGVKVAVRYTDEDGTFSLPGVLAGDYKVSYGSGVTDVLLPGTVRPERADLFTVRVGENTEINAAAPAPGTLSGRLTLSGGQPAAGLQVVADSLGGNAFARQATTRADGSWEITDVFPEDYIVSFTNPDKTLRQYAYGKDSADEAEVFSVPSGGTVSVNETWNSGATLTVKAVDATSGEPVSGYCVTMVGRPGSYCTEGSEVAVAGLSAGPGALTVEPGKSSDYVPSAAVPVTLPEGGHATITVPMTLGGRVNTLVVDRATGEPVFNACVVLIAPGAGGVDEVARDCTNKQGKLTTRAKPVGPYKMFVYAPTGYGAQWMTPTGGTGDQREATTFKVKAGKTIKTDPVLLDEAGTITGVVRDPAGQPMPAVHVDFTASDIGRGRESGSIVTDSQGRYTVKTLGPYAWPLLFTPVEAIPRQWSGGVGNRFQAETITVHAGETATYDMALRAGSKLTGNITVAAGHPAYNGGRLTAVNVATGDQIAMADFPGQGTYELTVIGGNPIKIAWHLATPQTSARGWWENAADMHTATKVNVPNSGTKTLNMTIG